MVLLIGLVLAAVFSLTCDKFIKKHAYILYIICAVVSVAIAFIDTKNLPSFVNTYIIGLFSRGAFATSLWIVVMWTGALKNGSKLIKKLMPIRGELSIMAAILTLAHNISFGKIYFVRLFTSASSMSATHLAAAIMSIVMLLIMIPLTIMSFPKVRKKMKGKLWKKIQRTAYLFYALIYLHVMTLYVPMAQKGQWNYLIGVILYSIIFIGYATCRIRKWYILRKKPENKIPLNVTSAVATAVFVVIISVVAYPLNQNDDVLTVRTDNDNANQTANSDNVEVGTEIYSEPITEAITESSTEESTEETATEKPSENPSEEATNATEVASAENNTQGGEQIIIYEQTNGDVQQSDAQQQQVQQNNVQQNAQQQTPQQNVQQNVQQNTQQNQQTQQVQQPTTEKVYVYNNGTYTATAFGYDGDVEVSVTIENDVITNITGKTLESDSWYFDSAKGSVFSQIISTQQTNVDAYSGATYSSKAIMTAVQNALNSARR